ncbi:MAG: T9SS type A sorting domain-containing protein [Saprospiraceae bacterium]
MKNIFFLLALLVSHANFFAQTQIQDADGDTRVQTEAIPNDNQIRMVTQGQDRLFIGVNPSGFTRMDVWNANQCLFIGQASGLNATVFASNNTGLGFRAGEKITSGFGNTFVGQSAGSKTSSGSSNVAIGSGALLSNTLGSSNVAVGSSSLNQLNNGTNNTAIGDFSLSQNLSSENTAIGSSALQNNTNGNGNTAIGRRASQLSTTGVFNTSVGQEALRDNTGSSNTALGTFSLSKNTFASFNVAVGRSALTNNTSGNSLSALGADALSSNTVGNSNTAQGKSALFGNTTGSANSALGANAGDLAAGNTNCTFLGFDSDNSSSTNFNNSTALGSGARINASNKIRFGNTAVTVIEGQVAYTVSDGRFKSKVQDDAPGLDFVLGLEPVTYNFEYTDFSNFLGETSVDYAVLREKEQKREMGFVAQDVERLCREQGLNLSNIVHTPESAADNYSVAYGQMVVPLVKAVQEQQAQIEELKSLVALLLAAQDKTSILPIIQTWPNPADDVLNVSLSGILEGTMLSLFSAEGKLLHSQPACEGAQSLDLKTLPSGSYFLQLNVPGKTPVTKPVVKAN